MTCFTKLFIFPIVSKKADSKPTYSYMAAHFVKSIQKIPAASEQVWDFFSGHANLQMITPPYMKFIVISQHGDEKLYTGQMIEYKVSPVLGIPLYWKTEIKNVNRPAYFIDEQRKGPYKLWQHQHLFKMIEGGVEMTDIVRYENPLWVIGELANVLFIKRKLRDIFEFRYHKIEEIFGKWPGGQGMRIEIR
jgi:ligand-binding SRPBCC domain-containing protein